MLPSVAMIFRPFLFLYAAIFIGILVVWFFFAWVGVISGVFHALGLPPDLAFLALVLSFIGSYINIPVGSVASGDTQPPRVVHHFGMRYPVPLHYGTHRTVVAVNVGGAIIPVAIAVYVLSISHHLIGVSIVGAAIVALIVNRFARPIPGLGIATPILIPPIIAALIGYLLGGQHADIVAYVSGVVGTLVGADIMNLGKISGLGAPVASIGGAGTFDGIFLTGIVAVLLA
jgi:uncharacterized membrane protein